MRSKVKKYVVETLKSDFSKNVLKLVSGTSVAQLIPLLAAPILSRIYTPEDFGLLALYLTMAQILGAIANGRYELAIILPEKKSDAVKLVLLSILIALGLSIITLYGVIFWGQEIAKELGDEKLMSWLYFLPFSVLMIGIFNALSYYNLRNKNFGVIAKSNIYKATGGTGLQVVLGLSTLIRSGGLIIGQVCSHFFGNIRLARNFLVNKKVIKQTTWSDIKGLAIRYQDFPKFSSWGIFINTISQNISNVFVARFFTMADVGFYSHAYRYLGLPLNLIGNSIGQVYMQRLSECKDDPRQAHLIFTGTLKKLTAIGLVIFIPAFFLIEYAYLIVFGDEWILAGKYAQLMLPLFFTRLISNPLSYTLTVFEKQKKSLAIQLSMLIGLIVCLIIHYVFKLSIESFIILISSFMSALYLFFIVVYSNTIKNVS